MKMLIVPLLAGALGLLVPAGQQAHASSHGQMGGQGTGMMDQGMMGPGPMMPSMDAARGRQLFASKGYVFCHSVHGVGGEDAQPLRSEERGGGHEGVRRSRRRGARE